MSVRDRSRVSSLAGLPPLAGAVDHGGPDSLGVPRWDFSSNANACGPEPSALAALRAADPCAYPDPAYQALLDALGRLHGVPARRVLIAASASEFIARLTSAVALAQPGATVHVPVPGYDDYARAARAARLRIIDGRGECGVAPSLRAWERRCETLGEGVRAARAGSTRITPDRLATDPATGEGMDHHDGAAMSMDKGMDMDMRRGAAMGHDAPAAHPAVAPHEPADLVWHTEPGSPCGSTGPAPATKAGGLLVIDCAYAPLRLDGAAGPLPPNAWQLWSPNKALGLTGVRGAYALAPAEADGGDLIACLVALAPSWPVGAHGVAMLRAWAGAATQAWVRHSRVTLAGWKEAQLASMRDGGWTVAPSVTPFVAARWPDSLPPPAVLLPRLREHGVKLRDTASMGLPGWVRLSVQPPEAQQALAQAWRAVVRGWGEGP